MAPVTPPDLTPRCCYRAPDGAACSNPAEWVISSSPFPDQMTEACTAHVGELLDAAPEHRVWPLQAGARPEFRDAVFPAVGDETALLRLARAAHAMQTGVMYHLQHDPRGGTPKHLRVGVNSAMVGHHALRTLLITKGVCTAAEYDQALADSMEAEAASYEELLSHIYGGPIRLV